MFRSFISSEAPQLLRQTHTDFSDFDPAPPNPNSNPNPVTPTQNPTPVTPTPTHAPAICPNGPIGAAALACGLPTSPSGDLVPQNLFGGSSEDDTDSESDDSESDTDSESDGSESDGSDGATDVDLSSEDEDG